MKLDDECRACLYNSQLKKVEKDQRDAEKIKLFRQGVKSLCETPPIKYCAPLLARDINLLHFKIFGGIIDYSKEKTLFNTKLLALEPQLYSLIISSPDPIAEGLKYAMASNFIDFARLCDLNEGSISTVIEAARKATVNESALQSFKLRLEKGKTLCYLHDNCGEIVLDKILIRVILSLYPQIKVTSVVRGKPVINDVTEADADEVGLKEFSTVISNGTDVPGTYLKEISAPALEAITTSDIVISKGLGNLETLYGCGYSVFYAFTCKCNHISKQFGVPMWSSVFLEENV